MDFRVKEICKAQGVTLKSLSAKLGISEVALRKALAGNPTIGTLEKIAGALGVTLIDLLPQPGENQIICPHCGKPLYIEFKKDPDSVESAR